VANHVELTVGALERSPELHDPRSPADADQLEHVRRALRLDAFPAALAGFYGWSDGGRFLRGNLELFPAGPDAEPDDLSLSCATVNLREWGWDIHDDAVVVGSNGGDAVFIWFPDTDAVELLEEDGASEQLASGIGPFLLGWTASYLARLSDTHDTQPALDYIGLPAEYRTRVDDEALLEVLSWAAER
jgi:hypothetical protein